MQLGSLRWILPLLLCLPPSSGGAQNARGDPAPAAAVRPSPGVAPPANPMRRVAVVKKSGLWIYERVAEEFRSGVRGSVRVFAVAPAERASLCSRLRQFRPDLTFAIGQSAYEVAAATDAPLIHAFAFHHLRAQHPAVSNAVPPELALRLFQMARPRIKTIGVLHGPDTRSQLERAQLAAAALKLELRPLSATTPAQAISLLRRASRDIQGLWLMLDLNILRAQVFQYALVIQTRRRIPLLGATRRHVVQGALFTLDYLPSDIGRRAAMLANGIIAGNKPSFPALEPRLSVNLSTAQRLGVNIAALRARASEVFQ